MARIEECRFSRMRTLLMSAAVVAGSLLAPEAFWVRPALPAEPCRDPAPFRVNWRNGT